MIKQTYLIIFFFVAAGNGLFAQTSQTDFQTPLTVPTGYGVADFIVVSPLALESRTLRLNRDRVSKTGVIPEPTAGYTLLAAVVVETADEFTLLSLGEAYGAVGFEEVQAAPGFWLVSTSSVVSAVDLAQVYRAAFGPAKAYVDAEPPRSLRGTPNDPLFGDQWHLRNTSNSIADSNAEAAWDAGYTGNGVIVGVLEGGFQTGHPDLSGNYNSTASQSGGSSSHGTSVAGVIGAVGNNSTGVIGVSYDCQISRQYFGSAGTTANAFGYRNDLNDIKNNSWGPFDDGTITYLSSVERTALENAVANGRGGLGEIFAWAAGNGSELDRVEYDPYASSRLTLAIGAIGDGDTRAGYNELGSSMLVVAHSSGNSRGITTTTSGSSYTSNFGGTSSSSPLGAGMVALMLEANPGLTWRDVQHVLINSARKNHPGDSSWTSNGAGREVNYNYGFGAMDAGAITSLAAAWSNVGPQVISSTGTLPVNTTIPDNETAGVSDNVTVAADLTIEHVEVILNVDHTYVGDLRVRLTSPNGTNSLLAVERGDSQDDYVDYIFTSVRHWDESSAGTWTLNVSDRFGQDLGTWIDWELKIYGTDGPGGGAMTLAITDPLIAGVTGNFDVTNGDPNTSTHLYYGRRTGSTFVPGLNVTLGLKNAKKEPASPIVSDTFGNASWTFVIPNRARNLEFFIQAAQFSRVSNIVQRFVL